MDFSAKLTALESIVLIQKKFKIVETSWLGFLLLENTQP